jgi:hypothetical protein
MLVLDMLSLKEGNIPLSFKLKHKVADKLVLVNCVKKPEAI